MRNGGKKPDAYLIGRFCLTGRGHEVRHVPHVVHEAAARETAGEMLPGFDDLSHRNARPGIRPQD
jgi:hypothetical protein